MPEILSGPVTGWPSMRILPIEGIFRPVVSFMKVDLPQPEGPTMAMNSPCFTLQVDGLDREVIGGEQLLVVGEPDVLEIDEAARRSARPPSLGVGRMFSSVARAAGSEPFHTASGFTRVLVAKASDTCEAISESAARH